MKLSYLVHETYNNRIKKRNYRGWFSTKEQKGLVIVKKTQQVTKRQTMYI